MTMKGNFLCFSGFTITLGFDLWNLDWMVLDMGSFKDNITKIV